MRPKICVAALTALILMLGVSLPVAADTNETEDVDVGKETSSVRTDIAPWRLSRPDRAALRSEQVRRRAKAHRMWINPWAEMRRDAWQLHHDAIAQAHRTRAAWDRAVFDRHTDWLDTLADRQFAWLDQQAEWHRAIADQQWEHVERVMDLHAGWALAHQPVPPYGYVRW